MTYNTSVVLDNNNRKWIEKWGREHCPKLDGDPNISDAIRFAIEIARLIDSTPEFKEIIDREFGGDYRMFIKRSCQDYQAIFDEAQHVQ